LVTSIIFPKSIEGIMCGPNSKYSIFNQFSILYRTESTTKS
jgi:hypothetical protein